MKVKMLGQTIVFTAETLVDAGELALLGFFTHRDAGIKAKANTPFELSVTVGRINQVFLNMENSKAE